VTYLKGKGKVALCLTKHHAMKTYCRSGGIAPHILDLGMRWRWVVSFTSRLLRRLGGPQRQSGHSGKEKISQSLHVP